MAQVLRSLKKPGTVVSGDETRETLVNRIMENAVIIGKGLMVFIPTNRGVEKRHDVPGTVPEIRTFVRGHLPRNLPSSAISA